METMLKAGYAKVDITPAYPVPLRGYGNTAKRIHTNVLDPIYSICVAISDEENTLLLYHLDLTGFSDDLVALCKEGIEKKHGIPSQNILFNVTHNHSAPDLSSPLENIKKYRPELCEKLINEAEEATADLAPVSSILIGSGKTHNLNFVRRYLLSDGSYGGDNFGDFKNNTILGHETDVDNVMQVVRLVREEKKDVLLVNWQGHPHRTGGDRNPDLSSDLIEHFRRTVEEDNDVLVSFYQGCGGNINTHSRIPEENTPAFYEPGMYRDYVAHGQKLGKVCTEILTHMRPVKSGKIRTHMSVFVGEINHYWDHRLEDAQKVHDYWHSSGKAPSEGPTDFAKSLGFNSVYHADAVIARTKMPATESYPIGAVSFGDVCIAWAPNELYDVTGKYLKATSPFEMTFACGYTNGSHGYMPTIKAFAHGGYGCDTCRFPAGVTEKLGNAMLEEILNVK